MDQRYRFPRTLSAPKRIILLTLDEAVPAILIFTFSLAKLGPNLTGPAISIAIIVALRAIKKGRGVEGFLCLFYWYMPAVFVKVFFPHLPLSDGRIFLR